MPNFAALPQMVFSSFMSRGGSQAFAFSRNFSRTSRVLPYRLISFPARRDMVVFRCPWGMRPSGNSSKVSAAETDSVCSGAGSGFGGILSAIKWLRFIVFTSVQFDYRILHTKEESCGILCSRVEKREESHDRLFQHTVIVSVRDWVDGKDDVEPGPR